MKKTLFAFAAIFATLSAAAGPVSIVSVRSSPARVSVPAARPSPAPAPKPATHAAEPARNSTSLIATNPALFAGANSGLKPACDDRSQAKGECKR